MSTELDLVAIGRVSVDLYGQQVGSRLEDIASFAKGVGGCPANVAIGAARLELKSALITRVGDEAMGRFVREQLAREGVDTRGVATDKVRLTPLVLLSVRDAESFPLIFYRENCADSMLGPDDIDAGLIGASRAVLVTGTHFSMAPGARAQRKAIDVARAHGRKVVLDIDYRPNLWGIGGHDAGESRYARAAPVTEALAPVLPSCDLIVGTEEEMHIAAGREDTLEAIRHIRSLSEAVIVCKRGALGCVVFTGAIPRRIEDALVAPGVAVEIYNVLGAGDAFLAGYLRGYLRDEPHEAAARYANACGAIAVSRLLCSAEFASLAELDYYLAHGSPQRALRNDVELNHLHWVTTQRRGPSSVLALSVADRAGHEAAGAARPGAERRAHRELLAVAAAAQVAAGRAGFGVLLGATSDSAALREAQRHGLWVGRAVEAASRPLGLAAPGSAVGRLVEWPTGMTLACRCQYQPDEARERREAQECDLLRLAAACRAQGRELLIRIGGEGEPRTSAVAQVLARLYELGIRPDWWALEPQPTAGAWEECARVVEGNDRYCRGVLVALEATAERERQRLAAAAACPVVRGFLAGGSIVDEVAAAGEGSAELVTEEIAQRFRALVDVWSSARDARLDRPERGGR